ncbi:hypothetical protein GWI33_015446 [Rhynchophorus ferrugineus]|uniref:Uncharacterized protein n=1 Tax=Rhynchophorus ferrugineus TaxID=354439 RepID=A0A834HZS3_RHYFE|nr:hypothetical protein GWI33_015446 [Rhynchophorus ferrugineus]
MHHLYDFLRSDLPFFSSAADDNAILAGFLEWSRFQQRVGPSRHAVALVNQIIETAMSRKWPPLSWEWRCPTVTIRRAWAHPPYYVHAASWLERCVIRVQIK